MTTYRYTNPENTVVSVIDEDGVCRSSMFVSAVPSGVTIEPYAPPAKTTEEMRRALVETLNSEYELRMMVIAGGYPLSERESWHVQTSEARSLLSDSNAVAPWITSAAAARQIDPVELATRIVAKDNQYRAIHGGLTGIRQHIEDLITAAGDDIEAINAIDVHGMWDQTTADFFRSMQ